MAREFARSRRVEEQIQRLLSDLIRAQVRDPGVAGVVVTGVQTSRDLAVARIRYGLLGTAEHVSPEAVSRAQSGLERAAGFLRSQLARELATRTVPELRFQYDEAAERGRDLERLIDRAVGRSGPEDGSAEPGGER